MTAFSVQIFINQPVEIVCGALLNPDNFPFWTTDLERFEVINGKPGEVGSVGLLHYSQNGQSYVMQDTLLSCEPGKRYTSHVSGDALTALVETTLDSKNNGTEMTITWSGKGKILLLKLLLPFLRGRLIRQSKAELETFKKLVETKGTCFSR
jgi:hypothetical protein